VRADPALRIERAPRHVLELLERDVEFLLLLLDALAKFVQVFV